MHRQINRGIVSIVAAIAFVLLTCASAAAQDVKYNYAMGTNFSKYKTYKWVDVPRENHPDQIADQQIRTAIEATLGTKGFTKATGDTLALCHTERRSPLLCRFGDSRFS